MSKEAKFFDLHVFHSRKIGINEKDLTKAEKKIKKLIDNAQKHLSYNIN